MGTIVTVLAIVGALIFFTYLKFPPPYANKKLVKVYDMMVLAVCIGLCLAWIFDARVSWGGSKWWQPVAIAGALAIEAVILGICFLLRNFWVFRPPRRPGGGFGF